MMVKTKDFSRSARKNGIRDGELRELISQADRGLIEADLGRCLIKQRLARQGEGKSGGYRVIIYYRREKHSVFLHLFPKSSKGNLTPTELDAYREFAKILDDLTGEQLSALMEGRGWRIIEDVEPEKNASKRPA